MTAMRLVDSHRGSEETTRVKIGKNCDIHPFVTIGYNGFGIIRDKDTGVPSQLPHFGGVVIGDNVRIGSHTSIERGTKPHTPTTIGNNVMIDSNVVVGHNSTIGEGTIIVSGTVIGGSARIGKNCFIGMNVSILQHIEIGDQVIIAAGAVVTKNVPSGDIVAGIPSRSINDKYNLSNEDRFRMVGY